ncbi:1-phosphofructokinase family hexose kinase [Nonomuraea diastatica]|uniref:1-phosphofructokinase family hexose kinase n=1 Tax=Nonomuraea diastatica TaxID=1848329 RepID=A0A4V2YCQ1_9ACTN|nr:1-phosphofructokinase family hexose kinase [Nonomuraea diastatica]TDD12376.1 1-phosphofructokinase family hexose kinase [Nonomuraea diastatica]
MILTVTLNLALDVTYQLPAVDWDGVNRVTSVHRRAGGKGVNVARVLAALGHEVLVTGLAGGPTGQAIDGDLRAAGLPSALTPIATDSRTTLAVTETPAPTPPGPVTDRGSGERVGPAPAGAGAGGAETARTALFNEPGPEVTPGELEGFVRRYESLVAAADAVVLSGSLPRGVPHDTYAALAAIAADKGVPAIVDADGEPLRHAPRGRPSVVKPNAEELARAVPGGRPAEGAQALRERGAGAVVVSMGSGGLLAVTGEGTFRARMPYTVGGNPTGAGDSLVAGLALGLVERAPWPDRLRRAAALGAAAVAAPVAGDFDPDVYADIHPKIIIT